MERLQRIVQLLARPIEFASRDACAHLPTIKNLGPYVSRRIVQALAEDVYAPAVETSLLALRQLFADFDDCLDRREQERRLARARAILARLSAMGTLTPDASRVTKESPLAPHPSPKAYTLSPQPRDLWSLPIRFAKGVGPQRATLLEKLGVQTVGDALWFLPWRYEDRSVVIPIGQLAPGVQAVVHGVVRTSTLKRTRHRRMSILDIALEDGTGAMHGVFFNQPYLETLLKPGVHVMLSGRVSVGRRGWTELQMDAPQYEVLGEADEMPLHVGRIVPIYHETKGFTSRQLRTLLRGLMEQYLSDLEEILPEPIRNRCGLPRIHTAVSEVHFPPAQTDRNALDRGSTRARRRLVFEEFFLLELALAVRQQSVKDESKGIRFNTRTPLVARLRGLLPFRLTPAQERVLSEILADMAAPRPTNRLIQGDVGCGKTIVAFAAMLVACGSGYQAALMVPTEILAEQHYLNLRGLIQALGLKAVLLKSGPSKGRTAALQQLADGEAHIAIGTHALIQKGVRFAKLGLAVIDEQHKFGVLQRKTLLEKGYHPDVLVLTATPIPRTLAMTVYGDLDVSVIDALPPGRTPIRTLLYREGHRRQAYQVLQDEVRAGHQVYIVYPLVEESEKVDLQAAIQAAERLQTKEFKSLRVGLLHGRMNARDKERTMAAFQAREIDILVSTTVVEVGVDVSNATVMLVEHAERFGLAQLHQLRGRVGRSVQQSYCLLVMSKAADSGVEGRREAEMGTSARLRLEALLQSNDGFVIAEEDLRIRGPGEFLGVRQWGLPEFRAANLVRDGAILAEARKEAFACLAGDPQLRVPAHQALRAAMMRRWQSKLALGSVS